MEQVRRMLAELTADPAVADDLRDDPSALAGALGLTETNVEALLDVDRFFDSEKAVVDHLVDRTDDLLTSGLITPEAYAGGSPIHECECGESVVAVMANFASVARKAIETLEAIHRHDHIESGWPVDEDCTLENS
jgi:hypothetical protein